MSDEAKAFNEYIVVVTNLNDGISAEEILETYRLRWQVEIYFKRLKSILDFGELPKRRLDSVIAWLNGKLMIALLIEILLSKTSFFFFFNFG
jgi:IS4 transposase